MEDNGIKALGDAQTPPASEDEFKGRSRGGVVVPDVDREEGNRIGVLGRARQTVALLECSSPGVEGGNGEAVVFAKGADGESALLPAFDQSSPVLFLAGIAGLAVGHG
jgi:hypothetical protein